MGSLAKRFPPFCPNLMASGLIFNSIVSLVSQGQRTKDMIHQIMRLLAIRSIENNDRLGLIRFLVWSDKNGIWSDSDSIANDMEPISLQEAKEKAQEFLASMVD